MARRSFTPIHIVSDAATTPTSVRVGQTKLLGYQLHNRGSVGNAFVKLYDLATAPTVGTDIPVMTIYGGKANSSSGLFFKDSALFLNGLGLGITVNAPDTDTTAPGGHFVIVTLFVE